MENINEAPAKKEAKPRKVQEETPTEQPQEDEIIKIIYLYSSLDLKSSESNASQIIYTEYTTWKILKLSEHLHKNIR